MDVVEINVGGTPFATSRSTLTNKEPGSLLARMFDGDLPPSHLDSQGRYFMDRDPEAFRYVMAYLRDQSHILARLQPQDPEWLGVLEEAKYFQLEGLEQLLLRESSIPEAPGRTTHVNAGVQISLITPGNGEKPIRGQSVQVHYIGTLASNGKKFDSSRNRGLPCSFKLGQGQVIKGWDEGVAQMSKGERAILKIASDYAYGSQGVGGGLIPPNSDLIFDVELVSFS